jgi:hypothetical protein
MTMQTLIAILFDMILIAASMCIMAAGAYLGRAKIKAFLQDFLEIEAKQKLRRVDHGNGSK